MLPLELGEQIHASDPRQLNVQDNGVRPVLLKKLLCLVPVPSLADNHNAAHASDQGHQALAHDQRIFHDQNCNRMRGGAELTGNRTWEIEAFIAANLVAVLAWVFPPQSGWLRCFIYHAANIGRARIAG
jgi:hypothetical protein